MLKCSVSLTPSQPLLSERKCFGTGRRLAHLPRACQLGRHQLLHH